MYCDICSYFHSLSGDINTSITKSALNAYKEGKAYSYFDCGWLKEVLYHPVSPQSHYCFMKSKCTPSQRIGSVPHDIWIMLHKKNGAIQSAYCTCFAGLGSTCNHVAAILFKMDYFWRQGITNKACTDKPCQWNRCGIDSTQVKPMKVDDINFQKPKFGKQQKSKSTNMSFENIEPFSFKELTYALRDTCPDSVVFQGQNVLSPDDIFTEEVRTSMGPSLSELLNQCFSDEEMFTVLKSFTDEDVINIEIATRGQTGNKLWKLQRVSRVTASIAHDVSTKMITLLDKSSKRSKDPTPMINAITKLDESNYRNIPQLKFGVEMEPEARKQYIKILSNGHKSTVVNEVGLVIDKDNPQYGASPDGIVSCSCCKTGLLEIKCPMSIAHTTPTAENVSYLVKVGDSVLLSKSSKYFSQVQWQMGICKKEWCDFFVYSRNGYHLERISFDEERFTSLMVNVNAFYKDYVIPAILNQNWSQLSSTSVTVMPSVSPPSPGPEIFSEHLNDTHVTSENCFILNQQSERPKSSKMRKTGKKSSEPVYLCGLCSKVCLTLNLETEADNSVQCDKCFSWYHFFCVSYIDSEKEWICQSCISLDCTDTQ